MSTENRAIHNLILNQDGGFSYSKPGSKAIYKTPHEHAATKALGQAAAVARAQRARREAELKHKAAQEADQKALEAEKAANIVKIGDDAKQEAEGEKQKIGFLDSLKKGAIAFWAFLNKPIGVQSGTRVVPDPYLAKAAVASRPRLAEALEDAGGERDAPMPAGQELRSALDPKPGQPVNHADEDRQERRGGVRPPAERDQAGRSAPVKPGQVEAETKTAAAVEKSEESERVADLTTQNFSSVEETPEGYRVTFPDKYELVIPRDSPEAKIFNHALNEVTNLTTQYDDLLKNVVIPPGAPVQPVVPLRPPEQMEGTVVRWPDAPGGVPRYALEMPGDKWQALNLSPEATKLLNEMHEKGVLSKAVVTMNPEWEVALANIHINGEMTPLQNALALVGKVQTPPPPASESVLGHEIDALAAEIRRSHEPIPIPITPEQQQQFDRGEQVTHERREATPSETKPAATDEVPASEQNARTDQAEVVTSAPPTPAIEPVIEPSMTSATPARNYDTSRLEVGTLILLPKDKTLCIGMPDGLHKVHFQGNAEEFFQTAQVAGVNWAGVERNEQGGLVLKTFVSAGDLHRSAEEVLGKVPDLGLLDDPIEQKDWRKFYGELEDAQKETLKAVPAAPAADAVSAPSLPPTPPAEEVAPADAFRSYNAARSGEKLEVVDVDGPSM